MRRAAYDKGVKAEERVAHDLNELGWDILARNWRGGRGELDVVASKDGHLQFVEVKARKTLGSGLEAVTRAKRLRLVSAGQAWLAQYDEPIRDVSFSLAIVLDVDGHCQVEWVYDFFDENE